MVHLRLYIFLETYVGPGELQFSSPQGCPISATFDIACETLLIPPLVAEEQEQGSTGVRLDPSFGV